jgi:hypothetical protein
MDLDASDPITAGNHKLTGGGISLKLNNWPLNWPIWPTITPTIPTPGTSSFRNTTFGLNPGAKPRKRDDAVTRDWWSAPVTNALLSHLTQLRPAVILMQILDKQPKSLLTLQPIILVQTKPTSPCLLSSSTVIDMIFDLGSTTYSRFSVP